MIKISKKDTIAIFAYNRPSHLRRVLISLENYKIPKETDPHKLTKDDCLNLIQKSSKK